MPEGAEILVIGSANIDLVIKAEHIPAPGENVEGHEFRTVPGGKGSNQAVAVSRMGGRARFSGCVGDDEFGKSLVDSLSAAGVDVSLVTSTSRVGTGTAVIVVDERTGESTIVVQRGANLDLTPEDVRKAFQAAPDAGCVLLQLETSDDVLRAAIACSVEAGIPAIVDAGPARGVPLDYFKGAAIVSPNSFEAEALTGIAVKDIDSAARCAERMRDAGIREAVFKLGEIGSIVVEADGKGVHVPAFSVDVVDTTAAGDSFMGALAVAIVEGRSLPDAARVANAAGALACTKLGAQPSVPYREDVETFLSSRGP